MDFDQAIFAHRKWKDKLRAYLAKPDHSLRASEVALDNACELGKWISSESKERGKLPEFQTLRSEHAGFHRVAADIIRKADLGKSINEEVELGIKSEFAAASACVVKSIVAVKAIVTKLTLVTK